MTIARFPSQIVIEDLDDLTELAVITMDDGATARVEIKLVINAARMAGAIRADPRCAAGDAAGRRRNSLTRCTPRSPELPGFFASVALAVCAH